MCRLGSRVSTRHLPRRSIDMITIFHLSRARTAATLPLPNRTLFVGSRPEFRLHKNFLAGALSPNGLRHLTLPEVTPRFSLTHQNPLYLTFFCPSIPLPLTSKATFIPHTCTLLRDHVPLVGILLICALKVVLLLFSIPLPPHLLLPLLLLLIRYLCRAVSILRPCRPFHLLLISSLRWTPRLPWDTLKHCPSILKISSGPISSSVSSHTEADAGL